MLLGREKEIEILQKNYKDKKSSLVVVYGRRRIGKSFLIHEHIKKHTHFHFEGIEGHSSKYHINILSQKIIAELKENPFPQKSYNSWEEVLELLTFYISKQKKVIIFLDEYQWICAGRARLTSLLKDYWDNKWKKYSVQLILCGSISSFMIKKVIKSKALYGRINAELDIRQLDPNESSLFFKKDKSALEKLNYLLVFGGTPKYLEDIKSSLSFEKNLADFFFSKYSTYINEYEKIFYSQFKEHQIYEKIINYLSKNKSSNLDSLAKAITFPSGGGLKSYLDNLEKAQFISSHYSSPDKIKSKIITYRLADPFLRFYLNFVFQNKKLIQNSKDPLSLFKRITKNKLNVFLGFAFENFCLNFALVLANKLGFEDEVLSFGPFLKKDSFQIDLIYFRENNNITICEIKHSKDPILPGVISDVENKVQKIKNLYPNYSIDKALISTLGPNKTLKASNYFEYTIDAKELLKA